MFYNILIYSLRSRRIIVNKYILKKWITLKARSDWLVKLRTSSAIYLRATRFVSVKSEEIIKINFLWCILSHCFSMY